MLKRLVNFQNVLKPGPLTTVAAVLLAPAAALAQEVAPDAFDTFAGVYVVLGGAVVLGLGWLITWGSGKLREGKASKLKEIAANFLTYFKAGLEGSHALFKADLEAARDPKSDGGVIITAMERERIRAHQWEYLKKRYISIEGVTSAAKVFIGGDASDEAAKDFINAKIDAGIAELDRKDKAAAAGGLAGPV